MTYLTATANNTTDNSEDPNSVSADGYVDTRVLCTPVCVCLQYFSGVLDPPPPPPSPLPPYKMYCTVPKNVTIAIDCDCDSFGYSTVLYCTCSAKASKSTISYRNQKKSISIRNSTIAVSRRTFSPPLQNGTVQYLKKFVQQKPYRTVPQKNATNILIHIQLTIIIYR